MPTFTIKPGDILVQYQGEPWVTAARIFTGAGFPHAQLVSKVEPVLFPIEEQHAPEHGIWNGYHVFILENSADGVKEKRAYNLAEYELWRPRTDEAKKRRAIGRMRGFIGARYGYFHLFAIGALARTGLLRRPNDYDESERYDRNTMVCSEAIARAYYHEGFDVAPGVSSRDTLPVDLRDESVSELIARLGDVC